MNFIQHSKALPYLLVFYRFLQNVCSTPVFLQVSWAGTRARSTLCGWPSAPRVIVASRWGRPSYPPLLPRMSATLILAADWQEVGCMCSDHFNDNTSDNHSEEVNRNILRISLPGNDPDAVSTATPCTGGVGVEA